MQVPHAQTVELEEVLADDRAAVVQGNQAQLVTARLHRDLQQRRPAAQHRAAQAQQQPLAVHGQAFDVEAVVLARDGHVWAEVGVIGKGAGEQVRLRIALQAQRLSAVLRLPHQAGLTLGVGLDRQAGQQPSIAVKRHLRQPLGVVGVASLRLGVLPLQAMRADHPEETVGHGHAFQVGLFPDGAGQVQQIAEREVAHFTKAQGLSPHGVEQTKAVQTAGLVACHPQPVTGKGRAREIGLNQGVRSELQTDGIGCSSVGHQVFLQGVTSQQARVLQRRPEPPNL